MKIGDIKAILTDKKTSDEKTSLENRFIAAGAFVTLLKEPLNKSKIDASTRKKLYQYYKQGIFGSDRGELPNIFYKKEREKWKMWKELGEMSPEEARKKYIECVVGALEQIEKDEAAIKIIDPLTVDDFKKLCENKTAEIEEELKKQGKSLKKNDVSPTFTPSYSQPSTLAKSDAANTLSSSDSKDNKDNISSASTNNVDTAANKVASASTKP